MNFMIKYLIKSAIPNPGAFVHGDPLGTAPVPQEQNFNTEEELQRLYSALNPLAKKTVDASIAGRNQLSSGVGVGND